MHSTDVSREKIPGECLRGAPLGASRMTALLLVTLATFMPTHAKAQWAWRARLDNDAYNFWQHPAARTDEEYSNGVRIAAETYRAPWWARGLTKRGASCDTRATSTATCVSHELVLGQEIYTPDLDRAPHTVEGWELERPYAAWLYVSSTARFARPRSMDEVEVAAGVTGQPALGKFAHTIAHTINERYTREAFGWDTQVGFEPGLLARYRRTWLARAAQRRGPGIELQPFVGAAAGNILTNAEVGLQLRVGIALTHPWHVPAWGSRPPLELFALGGVRQEFVARNISLDGNTVHAERAVQREAAVGEHTLGLGLRYRRVTLSWRAVTRGREYESGPKHHSYGIMQGGVEIVP
ncbi:MAG: lipid A deacylase LpxR family protein [Gemmatimonadaceae bacterium]